MRKVIVTGGAGYIGSHVVVELAGSGYQPIIIDNFSNSERFIIDRLKKLTGKSDLSVYDFDCLDKKAFADVLKKEGSIEGIIHFAAFKAVGESVAHPLKYYRNNLDSLLNVLELMSEYQIKQLVFSSSCTVYGTTKELPVTEFTPTVKADSPYGNTKKIGEEILKDTINSGVQIKVAALRYFNPVGAHPSALIGELPIGRPNNLIPFITQTAAGLQKELQIFGNTYNTFDGTCVRDFIHVVDLAKAHIAALGYLNKSQQTPLFDVFNIGTGKGNSVLEMVQGFEKVTGVKLNYRIVDKRSGDVEQIYADTTKANEVLGWNSHLTIEDSLLDAWNWQKQLLDIKITK